MQLYTQWERKKQSARGMYCPSLFGLGNQTIVFSTTLTDFTNFPPLQHPFLSEELWTNITTKENIINHKKFQVFSKPTKLWSQSLGSAASCPFKKKLNWGITILQK